MELRKNLLSGLFWVVLLNLLIKPFWILGIDVGVQNAVGYQEYGFYLPIFNLAYIFNILLDLGITNFNTRNIAQHTQLVTKHLSSLLCVKLLLLGLYLLITFSVGLMMGYSSREFHLLAFLSFNQFLNSMITFLRSNFQGLLMFKMDSVLSILDRVLMILICAFLLWGRSVEGFKIEWFVYSQTAAYLLTVILALLVLVRTTNLKHLHWNWPFTLAIFKQSLPFALLVLLMASYNRLDPIFLQQLLPSKVGDFQAGIYGSAFRILDALTMIAYLVSVPLLPICARNAKEGTSPSLIIKMIWSLMMVFSVTTSVTFSFNSFPLMGALYHDYVEESAQVFQMLVYCLIPISATYVFGTLLTAYGKLRNLNLLATITLLVNIVVNCLLIPHIASQGSAIASLVAQSFMAIGQVGVSVRMFKMKVSKGYLFQMALFCAMVLILNVLGSFVLDNPWMRIILVGIASLLVSMIVGLISPKEIISIMKTPGED